MFKSRWHYHGTTLRSECVFGRPRITEHARGGRYGDASFVHRTRSNRGRMHGGDDRQASSLPSRYDEGKLTGIISIGDLVKNIISNHQFTIDQLSHYLHGWGGKNTEVRN